MAASTFSPAEMEARRILLREELANLEAEKIKSIGNMQIIDFHHPERSPGWPIYRHQPYPVMLYHPTKKNEEVEAQRLGIRRRNEANPNLAPMDIPCSQALMVKAGTVQEKSAFLADGFVETAVVYGGPAIDANSPLEMIGRATVNPLVEDQAPTLSVETIIKLNQMPKEDLLRHAREAYGYAGSDEASKVDIINAIAKGINHAANAA